MKTASIRRFPALLLHHVSFIFIKKKNRGSIWRIFFKFS